MSLWNRFFGRPVEPAQPGQESPHLPFPYPLVKVPGADAVAEWRKHQANWRREGCSAVLLPPKAVRSFSPLLMEPEPSPQTILDAANGFSVEEFFAKRKGAYSDDEIDPEEGQWPSRPVSPINLNAHCDLLSQQPYEHVFLAKIPTAKPWEIPAYLRFGGWNECPGPEELAVVLRHWSQRYGIEIYSLSDDVMECVVARPPQTREDAMALAHEQFLVCSDIVFQGTESVALLAASLLKADAWYFWWD